MRRPALPLALALAGLLVPAAARAGSLPDPATGHRPGPDALYMKAPAAPQLENTGPWKADPILVSGAQAYRGGEWLYQDYLYDDHGAAGVPDSNTPFDVGSFLFSPFAGTYTYPTDAIYANNAADLVELRIKPLADETAFRITLNTLKAPEKTAVTIALGTSDAARAWPHGAGVSSPAALFLTVHGTTAELLDAATGTSKTPAPSASVDLARRQIEIRVPHAAWDPGTSTVKVVAGVGLWNAEAGTYLAPTIGSATATTPGGGLNGAALVNVGPRLAEPAPDIRQVTTFTFGDAAAGGTVQARWWRERAQADALRGGSVAQFATDVDFAKLAAGTTDESGVPTTGPITRILASRHDFGQGMDPSKVCYDLPSQFSAGAKCIGRFVGQLQPYALYVPKKPMPADGWGMTLLLHSLSANYNQYTASRNQSQLGERGAGSLVLTPAGRGPDGFYAGIAEADTFEAWADVARHYELDPDWTAVSGYSMGGFGTYRMLARWPDLFARGFSVVGIPGSVDDQLESLRNTPLLAWNAAADELVNVRDSEAAEQALAAAGLRFQENLFLTADHLSLATNDEYAPGAEFLGNARVDRDPPHVSYVLDGSEDSAEANTVADHAYWASGLAARDAKKIASFDARSQAFGVGDPKPSGVTQGTGTLDGGTHGPMPFASRTQTWGPVPSEPKSDTLVVKAANLAAATVDARRARLSCAPALQISSDGPLDLKIDCSSKPATPRACANAVTLRLPRLRGQRIVAVRVTRAGKRVATRRGRNLRTVTVRRPGRGAFNVRIVATASGKGKKRRTVVILRRISACSA